MQHNLLSGGKKHEHGDKAVKQCREVGGVGHFSEEKMTQNRIDGDKEENKS